MTMTDVSTVAASVYVYVCPTLTRHSHRIDDGVDQRTHHCLVPHPSSPSVVTAEPCIHEVAVDATLVNEAHNQLWTYTDGRFHHQASGHCLTAAPTHPHEYSNNTQLVLAACTEDDTQKWIWSTGLLAERNPHVFEVRMEQVRRMRASEHGHPSTSTHPSSALLSELQSDAHHTAAHDGAEQHASLIDHELQHSAHEDAAMSRIEQAVEKLLQQQQHEQSEIDEERHALEEEKTELGHQQHELEEEEAKYQQLEHRLAAHETDAHNVLTPEPVHFFTPLTIILSLLFVAVLAAVFRIYLFPLVLKRWSNRASNNKYYAHAY